MSVFNSMSQHSIKMPIQMCVIKKTPFIAVATLLGILSACSGDGRPLTEAVEANSLNLKSLTIVPPTGQLNELYVSPGESISLKLEATDTANKAVSLSSDDRRWIVDQPTVLKVDENGNLYALSEGTARVSVRVGGVGSAAFSVNVRDEVLDSIELIKGADSLERCIPTSYQAVGRYLPLNGSGEGSLRGLYGVKWSVTNTETFNAGSVAKPVNGFASVTGVNVGNLQLIAEVGNKRAEKTIEVENTLQEISIDPELAALSIGTTLKLKAKGLFVKDGETPRPDVDLTDAVQWSVLEETTLLSIGNNAFNKGIVTPKLEGDVQVVAACGDISQQKTVLINSRGEASNIGLSLDGGTSTRQISLAGGPEQLRVSTGTTYNENNDVTEDADWLVLEGSDIVEFNALSDVGEITPLRVGTAKIQATYDGRVVTLNIRVNQL